MKKKVLSIFLASAMALSMAACGNNAAGGSASGSGAAGATGEGSDIVAEAPSYTYHTYSSALANNWNEHSWETNADDTIRSYITSPLVTMSIEDSENGVYQWIYEMATSVEDVTASHQDDLTKYKVTLQSGKTAADTKSGFVFEIKLREGAKWQDGTPINADSYIYSMKQLLNPQMQNYRANLYYAGESAVAGGFTYYNSLNTGYYVPVAYSEVESLLSAGKDIYIDVWSFYGAEGYTDAAGNVCPQYVSVKDDTVWGEAQDDAFSGADLYATYDMYFVDGSYSYYQYQDNENYNENFEATYDDIVGCYKVDDYTIRYVTQTYIDFNYFLTSLTSNWLVYEKLYEAGKDTTGSLVTTDYCTSVDTTMSYGPYKIVSLQTDKQMVLEKNENYWGYEKQADGSLLSMTEFKVDGESVQQWQTSRIVIDVMDDAAAKQAFLKGELSDWTPTPDDLVAYATSERLYKADETYTMSFFFNTNLDNLKEMDKSKGNTNSVVLSNENFRKAFSLAINRDEWVGATAGYKPAYAVMNNLYFYDAYNDPTSSYRGSDAAMQAICNVYGVSYGSGTPYATLKEAYESINGYNLTEAQALMKQACDELVAAGLYKAGEPIYIRIGYKAGALDSSNMNQVELMNRYLNAAVEGSGFGTVTLEAIGNITNRYADTVNGEYAIGYGAWGGAAFYPFRNFQVYCDPSQYDLNEAGCWDPSTETLTLKVNGEDVTMTWQEWSGALIGSGRYTEADFATKLDITAQMEEAWLKKYYRIPLASTTACFMMSYQVNYYTEEYNIMYDFGGLRLMQYNYTDAEWEEYVKSQNGNISYE
ncbi:MAG: ABC transporter substrate-binding protein [Acetatifactor sp.]